MEQWNLRPPPLSLWSRPDWNNKHKAIARKHGHLLSQHKVLKTESLKEEMSPASHAMDDNHVDDLLKSANDQGGQQSMNEGQKGSLSHRNVHQESQERQDYWMSKAEKTSRKRKQTEEDDGRELGVTSPAEWQAVNQMLEGVPDQSPSNPVDGRSSVESFQQKSVMTPSYFEVGDNGYMHLEPTSSVDMEFGAAYSETQKWPSVTNPLSGYGVTDIEKHHSRLPGDNTNSLGYSQYLREIETGQQIGFYGLQDPPDSMRSNYLSGHDAAHGHMRSSYGGLGSVSEPSNMMNTPAMQRYAPRLDELNHVRMDSLGSGPPIVGRNGTFERNVPQPGFGSGLPSVPGLHHHVYSRQNSSGWFNE